MKKILPGHLVGFEELEEMLDYDGDYPANGAMSEWETDYHSEWEDEFQEELCKKVLEENLEDK